MRYFLIALSLFSFTYLSAQKGIHKLQSGPMVGYSEMREVMLWVQTNSPADVAIEYQEKGKANAEKFTTNWVKTEKSSAFTAHLLADKVLPGKDYTGTLMIDGKAVALPYPIKFHARDLWHYRTDPPAFKAVIGSCAYFNDEEYDRPGKGYGGEYEIFEKIHAEDADLMVWLGDNIYLREADWGTQTGMDYRYTHVRSQKVLQPLLAGTHHYAIWDDHDFGPNDADRAFVNKEMSLDAFKRFWANPSYGVDGMGGIASFFSWSDCDFWLIDNRYFRAPNNRKTGDRTMLGKAQLRWLIDGLSMSRAPFKFVCIGGMVLSSAEVYENYIRVFPEERKYLMDALQAERIEGVVFLSGDRHHTELTKWDPRGGLQVHDLTISPFTSGSHGGDQGANVLLVPDTEVEKRNYATLEVSGPRTERVLKITVKDVKGETLWTQEIKP